MNRTVLTTRIASRIGTGALLLSLFAIGVPSSLDAQLHEPSATPARPPFYAIQNARIVTGTGSVIESGTVVIANGLIEAVGASATVPPEAWVIDGSGLTVYPGLFDGLSDVGIERERESGENGAGGGGGNPFLQLANQEVSTGPGDRPSTNSWVHAADLLNADADEIETWRQGGFTTALVTPGEGIVTGQAAVVDLAGTEREMVVKSPAALRLTLEGGGFRSYPGSLMGVISYIEQLYLDAGHRAAYEARYEQDPRGEPRPTYDRALDPIQDAIDGGWPTIFPADEVKEIRRMIELGEETGARTVLAGGHDAYEIAPEIAAAGVPVLVSLDWPEKDRNVDPEEEESLQSLRRRAYAPTTPARLEEAGATWAFYSDGAGNPREAIEGVRKAIESGLSEDAALRALTISPARIYGVDQIMGSVEEGKIANLVVTDGDLFAEDTEVKMVFVDGKKFEEPAGTRPTDPPAVDMTGTWIFSLQDQSQEATAELTMAEDGTLTGTIQGERGEQTITDGWVSGNQFSITATASMGPAGTVEVVYSGTVEEDSLEGTASFGGRFTQEFTGTRPGGGQ